MAATTAALRIGELAERVDVNPRTVRYYESIGLLPEPDRTPSGYRQYDERDVDRLAFVRRAQALGLTLDEIGEVLALRERAEAPCGYVLDVAATRLGELDRRIAELEAARDELATLLDEADDLVDQPAAICPLIEHHRTTDAD